MRERPDVIRKRCRREQFLTIYRRRREGGADRTPLMSADNHTTLAKITLHPLVIIGGAFIVGSAFKNRSPVWSGWALPSTFEPVGMAVMVAGMMILVAAYTALARASTTINPRRATTRVVSTGIYRLSRNPIYLGWFMVLLGAGLENGRLAQVWASLVMIVVLHWAVVLPEERYLAETFGDDYVRYKQRVRRWL